MQEFFFGFARVFDLRKGIVWLTIEMNLEAESIW